jgi:hypothetical protein
MQSIDKIVTRETSGLRREIKTFEFDFSSMDGQDVGRTPGMLF